MSRAQNQNTSTTRTESQDRSTFPSGQGGVQVLRLRGEPGEPEAPTTQRRRIRWAEDVVDNEGQGKKSSKVCCIFHKARPVGESSSESESDSEESDSSSSDESDSGSGPRKAGSGHHHEDGNSCKGKGHKRRRTKRKFVPNAYERMPSNRIGNNSNQPS